MWLAGTMLLAGCAGTQDRLAGKPDNAATVQQIYAAFGRGDVKTILERVVDDTRWDFNGGSGQVPWHKPVTGKASLPDFFGAFGGNVTLATFEPTTFATVGPHVAVRVRIAYTVKRTGKQVEQEQVHWWTFNDAGRVVALRHFEDTAAVIAANR